MTTPRHPRLVGLLASLALAGLLVGLPAVLLALGWGTLPGTPEGWWAWLSSPDDGRLAVFVFKVAGWIGWALLAVSIITELIAAARGLKAPKLSGLGWSQAPARRLVAAATLLFISLPTAAGTIAAAAPVDATPATQTAVAASVTPSPASAQPETTSTATQPETTLTAATPRHIVVHGDSLWSIAERYLGSGTRYPEIAALNATLLNEGPGFLQPGWVLTLPAEATAADSVSQYTVAPGDTLSGIARTQLGDETSWPRIYRASTQLRQDGGRHLSDPDLILPGWTLAIPGAHPAPAAQDAAETAAPSPDSPQTTPTAPPSTSAPATSAAPATDPVVPTQAPAQTAQSAPAEQPAPEEAMADAAAPPWLLLGLSGAGVVLAGSLALALHRRRRSQFRARRPGRTIRPIPAGLAPVEKSLIVTEAIATSTVTQLDQALLELADAMTGLSQPLPLLEAARLLPGQIEVVLAEAAQLPAPWIALDRTDERWRRPAGDDPRETECRSPYPQLVTVGRDETDNSVWLVNLEALGTISLAGDPTFAQDFARYLAAEIALNPWSREVRLDCVGVAAEAAELDPSRVRHYPLGDEQALRLGVEHALETIQRCADLDVTSHTGRANDAGGDLWSSWLLLVNGAATSGTLDRLLDVIDQHPQHTGAALVMVGDGDPIRGTGMWLSEHGRVRIPCLHLDLEAVGLTPDEAQGCAMLLAAGDDLTDAAMPNAGEVGWRENCDAAGAPRPELVLPRDTDPDQISEDAASVLPGLDEEILLAAAAVPADLEQLAPLVPASTRERVEKADGTLDADVAAWLSGTPRRPRLSLLGPITARTGVTGDPSKAAKRKPFYTELLAFLALHPEGVTTEQLVGAFGKAPVQMRKHMSTIRDWLGKDPATGKPYLPAANASAAHHERGLGLYQLDGVLVDIDLFRRLRVRGTVRGPEGLDDLTKALELVSGIPFHGQRGRGWAWIADGDRVDHHMICAIVDVAHTITMAALPSDTATARAATEKALLAAPYEDTPQLDLAAIIRAEGNQAAAQRHLIDNVCNRTEGGEAPEDLTDRTEAIVRDPRWAIKAGEVA